MSNNAIHRMATRVTIHAWSLRSRHGSRHGQPSVIADVRSKKRRLTVMTNLETDRRSAILKTPFFWTKLEFEISGWLAESKFPEYRKYWIDGFEPDSVENTKEGAQISGLVWMAIGSRSQEKFHFTLSIPQALLYRLQSVHEITSVLIDESTKRIEITLERGKAQLPTNTEQADAGNRRSAGA